MNKELINKLKFNEQDLIPAIAQDFTTNKVLMQAWMSRESLEETIKSGFATYYSRSRQELWKKGETSGNVQKIVKIVADCDYDCILLTVEQTGPACHTGAENCFFNEILR